MIAFLKTTIYRFAAATLAVLLMGTATRVLADPVFVTRSGSSLQLNGAAFRFSGSNAEWLGAAGNTTPFQVEDALATMKEMGQTVTRSLYLTSIGTADSLQPSLRSYNDVAFSRIDYVIKLAGDYNIRLIIPLCDQNANGDGAYSYYTRWRGITDASKFYSDATVISDYKAFIFAYLNHVNVFTGVANKDNPTILAWETGNELQNAPTSWTQDIASYIKSIDSHHLIADGACNFVGGSCRYPQDDLAISNIDIYTDHFYPMNVSDLTAQANAAFNAGKSYFAGEYDWAGFESNSSSLSDFLHAAETSPGVSGDLMWELFGRRDNGGYQQYRYAGAFGLALGFHYPGDNAAMQTAGQQLRSHAYAMRGITSPPAGGAPSQPWVRLAGGSLLTWRGALNGASYSIERSTAGALGPWTVVCNQCVGDVTGIYADTTQPSSGDVWYRMRAFNLAGTASDYSGVAHGLVGATLPNPGFETPSTTSYVSQPSGAGWSFTGAGVSANNSAFTNGNPSAPEGSQVGFIQGQGSISASVNLPTNTLACLTFAAAQRGNYNNGGNDLKVYIDSTLIGTIKPTEADYLVYATSVFNVSTPAHTLTLTGADTAGGDNTVFVDGIGVAPECPTALLNAGFETPSLAANQFTLSAGLPGDGWTFSNSGVTANGSGYTSGNPPAPEGAQVALLQGANTFVGQVANGLLPSTNYCARFSTAQRGNYNQGGQDYQLYFDWAPVGSLIRPSGSNYQTVTSSSFQYTGDPSRTHVLVFAGKNSSGGDNTALIDSVSVAPC